MIKLPQPRDINYHHQRSQHVCAKTV